MTETTGSAIGALAELQGNASLLLLVTDRAELAAEIGKIAKIPVLVATSDGDLAAEVEGGGGRAYRLHEGVAGGLGLLPQVKEVLLGAYLEGFVGAKERVLCLASAGDALDVIAFFDVARDLELGHLREEIGARVPMAVMDRVLRLAGQLAHEGREGKPIGTLFVIGDTQNVLARSRAAVLNPFQGHPPAARTVMDDAAWETIKEFAQLDGAFVLREDGVVLAAGRYMQLEDDLTVHSGLGGRHLAAASVTKTTKAVAVAVSSNGAVRVFKDGRVLMVVGKT